MTLIDERELIEEQEKKKRVLNFINPMNNIKTRYNYFLLP